MSENDGRRDGKRTPKPKEPIRVEFGWCPVCADGRAGTLEEAVSYVSTHAMMHGRASWQFALGPAQ